MYKPTIVCYISHIRLTNVSTGHTRRYVTKKIAEKCLGLRHPSHRATKPLINSRFVWHGMNIDIANWCRSCTGCQTAKYLHHNKPVFERFEEPTERFDHVHVDLVGPSPYSDGFKYLLTCVDRFTRWPEAILLIDIRAETVANAFFQWVWWLVSGPLPQSLRTEVPSSKQGYRTPCVINSASPDTAQRVTTLSQTAWLSVFIDSLKPQSWPINHRIRGQLRYLQFYSASDQPSRVLGRWAAEVTYGMKLHLPCDFTENYTVDANTDLENYSDRLHVAMSRLRLSPRATYIKKTCSNIRSSTHVFLWRIAIAPPLTAPYDGPYKVVARSGWVFKVMIKGLRRWLQTVANLRISSTSLKMGAPDSEEWHRRQNLRLQILRQKFVSLGRL